MLDKLTTMNTQRRLARPSRLLRHLSILLLTSCFAFVAAAQVTVFGDPDGNSINVGDQLLITVKVDAGTNVVTSAQVQLDFDPSVLQVVPGSVSGSGTFNPVLAATADNSAGTINFAGGFGNATGIFNVFSFTVEGIAMATATDLTFNFNPLTGTDFNDFTITPDDITVTVIAPNSAPGVSVVSPAQGTASGSPTYQDVRFPSGSTIPLVVDATDSDGTVSTVEFFDEADNALGTGTLTTGTKYQFDLTNAIVGAFSFKATATDDDGAMGTSGLSDLITVFERTQSIPGVVEAENFITRSSSILTQDNGGNDAGGLHIGFIENNSFTSYEVSVANNITYDVVVRAASDLTGGTITFKDASNNILGSIEVTNTTDWQNYEDFTGQVTFLTSGTQDLILEYTGSSAFLFNLNAVTFTEAVNDPPTISAIPDQTNAEGDVVNLDLSVYANDSDGTIASYELTSGTLPDGLSLNATTGLISGTLSATAADNSPYSLTVAVRDDTGDISLSGSSFTWTVTNVADLPPTINPVATQEFAEGDPVAVAIQVNDDMNPAASVVIYDLSEPVNPGTADPGATVDPADYSFTDNGSGSYTLLWNTGPDDGRAYQVEITANDGVNAPVTSVFDLNIAQILPDLVESNTFYNPDPWYGSNPPEPFSITIENNTAKNIGFISTGDVADYLVDVPAGDYVLTVSAATNSGQDDVDFSTITFSEEDGATFSPLGSVDVLNLSGQGWQNYNSYDVNITLANDGLQTIRLSFEGGVNVDFFELATPPDNAVPVITLTPAGNQIVTEGETLEIDLAVNDPDGNIQNNTVVTGPAFLTETASLNSSTDYASTLSFAPQIGDAGVYTVTVTTNDGINIEQSTSFQLTVAQPVPPCDVKYRVNSGGPVVAGSGGDDWTVDNTGTPSPYLDPITGANMTGDKTFTTASVITNTTGYPTALFQTERYNDSGNGMSYTFPVVAGGEYEVRLFFAEIFAQEPSNNRVFDILIDGTLVEDGYRPYTAAGDNLFTAVVESYTVTASSGSLNIFFDPVSQNPAIKAIQICTISEPTTSYTITASAGANGSIDPEGAVTVGEGASQTFTIIPDPGYVVDDVLVDGSSVGAVTTYEFTNVMADATIEASFALAPFAPIYVNAGGGAYTAQDGREFAADNGFTGGEVYPTPGSAEETTLAGVDFFNTQDDELFRTERFGDASYSFPVPDGNYIVELFFAEIFQGINGGGEALPGERIFDVNIEGGNVELSALDLLDPEAGGAFDPGTGIVKSFAVSVSDGALDIVLTTTVDNAKISAICIREDDGSLNTPPVFDPVAGTTVTEGDQAVIAFSAMDNNAVTDFAVRLVDDATGTEIDPAEYSFNPSGAGGTLEWNTTVGDAGSYTGTLLAFDGLDVNNTSFTITVDPLTYTITASAGNNGTISPSGAVSVPAGGSQTFTFTPADGFNVAQILVDGSPVAIASEYTFSDVQADATISVTFSQGNQPPVVTITAPATGTTVERGADINFMATANDPEEGDISAGLNWSSSDPQFNVATSGPSVTGKLRAVGTQTVSASVADNEGLVGIDEISLTVPPPAISFVAPTEGQEIFGTSVTVDIATTGLLLDEDEHFHFYINPADPDNPNYADRISTIGQPGVTMFTFTSDDGIVLGANTIVVIAANSSHVEFNQDSARDVVNFTTVPNTNVFLSIDPAVSNVNEGEVFTVDIVLDANDQEVTSAEIAIAYDNTVLNATQIVGGSTLPTIGIPQISNANGTIRYAGGLLGGGTASGSFVLATITFEAIGGPTSGVDFFNNPAQFFQTVVNFGSNNDVLTGTNNGVVNVTVDPALVISPAAISSTVEIDATSTEDFTVESNDASTLPSAATITLVDDATGLAPTWASTVASADQGTTYQITFDATGLTPDTYNATLTASGVTGYDDASIPVTLVVEEPAMPMALFEITPGAAIDGTTFDGTDNLQLTNQSTNGLKITRLDIDLSTTILPDMVFDPTGSGGDATAQCFDPNATTATTVGLVNPVDPCTDPFSQPRQGGFDVLSIEFTDFDPGEFFSFSTDIDPNSIQGVLGAGASGAVSGMELAGATITITFDNGDVLVSNLYEDGSFGGSQSVSPTTLNAPTIAIQGVSPTPATVGNQNQTVQINGASNAYYSILQVDARLYIASGNDPFNVPDPTYYANEAVNKVLYSGQLDASGNADVPVTLLLTPGAAGTPDGGLNHFIAVQTPVPYAVDQPVSQTSNLIVLKYDPGFVACDIISAVPGTQTCEEGGYSQEVVVTYEGNGNGDLVVNGQAFAPTGSPQTVTLTGLVADGQPVDLTVSFPTAPINCEFFQAAAFTAPTVPTYTVAGTNPTSCLGAEGSLLISELEADTEYSVSIDGGATSTLLTSDPSGEILFSTLGSGQYDVIVALNQCGGAAQTIILMDPDSPTYSVSGSDPTACGLSDGSITISELMANTSYSYDLGTGASPAVFTTDAQGEFTITGLGADDYSIVVTTLTKCAGMAAPVTLSEPAGPTFAATGTDPTTCEGTDGFITISGLTQAEIYSVDIGDGNGASSFTADANGEITILGLSADSYSVVVSLDGCDGTPAPVMLSDPAAPTYIATGTDPTVCGGTNGSITITGLTQNTAYDVDINDGSGVQTLSSDANGTILIEDLSAGPYSVVVSLANCASDPVSVSLDDPDAPVYTVNGTDPITCGGNDGVITISGLTNGEAYEVNLGTGGAPQALTANGNGEIIIDNLAPDTYTVSVSLLGCIGTSFVLTLEEPTAPTYGVTSTDPTACATDDGVITITGLTSGVEYQVDLNDGNGSQAYTATVDGEISISSLAAGNYTVSVTLFNCTGAAFPVTLSEPIAPTYTAFGTDPSGCDTNDGSITVTGLSTFTTYDIDINDGNGSQSYTSDGAGEILIDGLADGGYSVVVSLANCAGSSIPVTLTKPDAPTYVATGGDPTGCGTNDGTISITGLTATTTYSVDLNDGNGPQTATSDAGGTIFVTDLGPASYSVVVSLNGCSGIAQVVVLSEPGSPTYQVSTNDVTECDGNNGSILVFGLNASETYNVNIGDGNGFQALTSTADGEILIEGLTSGTYSVTLELNGCTGAAVPAVLTGPTTPTYQALATNPTVCNGSDGSITISNLMATTTYSVDIGDGSGPQTLTSNTAGEILVTNLSADSYSVVVSSMGCPGTPIPVSLSDPEAPTYSVLGTDPSACGSNDGSIVISGLTANTQYSVDLGNGAQLLSSNTAGEITFNGLAPNTYSVTITLEECTGESIPVTLSEPPTPTYTVTSSDPTTCEGTDGNIIIDGLEASTTYAVDLGDGNGAQPLTSDSNGEIFVGSLSAGSYLVVVSSLNCDGLAVSVDLTDPPTPTYAVNGTNPTGCASNDGSITISGLMPNTDYAVNIGDGNGLQPYTTDADGQIVISNLDGDGYTVSVTLNACTGMSMPVTLTEPDAPTYTANGTDPTGCTTNDGIITISGLDANTDYTVSIGDGNGGQSLTSGAGGEILLTGLGAGSYTVVVSFNGCTGTGVPITLTQPDAPTYTVASTDPTTCSGTDGSILISDLMADTDYAVDINDGNGSQPYTSDANGQISIGNLGAANYTVIVTLDGCIGIAAPVTLTDPDAPTYSVTGSGPTTCNGNDGSILIFGLQPETEYTVDLGDGSTPLLLTSDANGELTAAGLVAGDYSVVVSALACAGPELPVSLSDPAAPTYTAMVGADPSSCGATDGSLTISGLLATTDYAVDINDGNGLQPYTSDANGDITVPNLSAGSYTVSVTLSNCTGTGVPVVLSDPAAPSFTLVPTNPTGCGAVDGSIVVTGLQPSTEYIVDIGDGSGAQTLTTDANGEITFDNLLAGDYSVVVTLDNCASEPQLLALVENTGVVTDIAVAGEATCGTDGTYSQSLVVTYQMPPAMGVLIINGQSFTPTGSPQTIVLTGLTADGAPVDVTAFFEGISSCGITETGLFTAPSIPIYNATLVAPESCSGEPGDILVTGLQATTEYEVSIDGGTDYAVYTSNANGEILIPELVADTYTVLVRIDVCDGPAFDITVPDSAPITYNVIGSDPTECTTENGQIEISGLNPNQEYSISLGNGLADQDLTADAAGTILIDNLPAGSYLVAASTAGCSGDAVAIELVAQQSIYYTPGAAAPTSCNTNDGVIVLIGLAPNTEYLVDYGPVETLTSDFSGTVTIFDLGPGSYSVSATLGQCTGPIWDITFDAPEVPTFTATEVADGPIGFSVLLSGLDDFEVFTVDLGNGQPAVDYTSDANGDILLVGLAAGTYSITVELEGCVSEPVEITLEEPNMLLQAEWVEAAPGRENTDVGVRLDWSTAFERPNGYFEVQRSTNGSDFVSIGEVLGEGNSLSPRDYLFLDETVAQLDASRLYYRLRQLNSNGSYTYSDVVSVDVAARNGEFQLLYLTLGSHYRLEEISGQVGIETVEVYNMNGQLVGRDSYNGIPAVDLRTDHLPAGTYLVIANGTFRERMVIIR